MMKKWKRLAAVFALCFLVLVPSASVGAAEEESTYYCVYDDAYLLTDTELAELEAQMLEMAETTGWNILAVTTDDALGKTARAYADDFYDETAGKDTDGILALIDMDNREIYLSTSGIAIRYLTDDRIDSVLDSAFSYVSEGAYGDCLSAMLSGIAYYYGEGIPEDQYNYDVETGAVSRYRTITWMEAVPVVIVAILAGAGIYFGVAKSYHMNGKGDDYPYTKYGNVHLMRREDRFINQTVTHHRIQNNNGGSGSGGSRSSTHQSSSGGTHGGGGRSF